MKVLCIGHASYDITLPVDSYPLENKKIRIGKKIECGGGPASNAAYLIAKWGMDVSFAGLIGNDYYGKKIEKEFLDIGINTKYLEIDNDYETTSSYIIANKENGTRTILTSKGNHKLMNGQGSKDNYDVILVDGQEPDFSEKMLDANKEAISVLDAGRSVEETIKLGHKVKYLICSKDFAEEYTNKKIDYNNFDTIRVIYDKLVEDFKTIVVITLEDKGCYTKLDNYTLISSIKVKAIDSTGAGDIFHGAFTYFISNGYSFVDSLKLANITGALAVTKIGSRYKMPELSDVLRVYDDVFK